MMLGLNIPNGRSVACLKRYSSPKALVKQYELGRSPSSASVIEAKTFSSIHLGIRVLGEELSHNSS